MCSARAASTSTSDAVFGVRSSLVAEWVRHEPGRTPDGQPARCRSTPGFRVRPRRLFRLRTNRRQEETNHECTSDRPPHRPRRCRRQLRAASGLTRRRGSRRFASAARSRSPGRCRQPRRSTESSARSTSSRPTSAAAGSGGRWSGCCGTTSPSPSSHARSTSSWSRPTR